MKRFWCGLAWGAVLLSVASSQVAAAQTWQFSKVTSQAGVNCQHDFVNSNLSQAEHISGGVAVGDYDRDGWLDLYVVTGDVWPNVLYRNLGDGTFEDVAAAAGVAMPGTKSSGPTFVDYNGDRWLDLCVGGTESQPPRLFRNLGNGTFQDVTEASGLTSNQPTLGSSWGDYDKDGDLDAFLPHWTKNPPGDNHVWRNNGNGTFTPVDALVGIGNYVESDYTFTGNWADINDDTWPDLLIASDFGTSRIYLNDGDGTFTETTTGVISDENGMGAGVADYDNDGDLDWFVSSIYLQTASRSGISGNRMYRNLGDGTFEDATDIAGVRIGHWGWGSSFADFNNDGWLDLYHTNGWFDGPFATDPCLMYVSNQDGTFTDQAMALGVDDKGLGRGIVCFDYDRDGDLDIFIANNSGESVLFRNDGGNAGNWLSLRLVGTPPNSEAIGARIWLTAGTHTQMRELRCGSNFVSQDPSLAHFGLGNATNIDELEVHWPDGEVTVWNDVSVNQELILHRQATDVADRPAPQVVSLASNRVNPVVDGNAEVRFGIPQRQHVTLRVYNVQGRLLRTVVDETLDPGFHRRTWLGLDESRRSVARGVYFLHLRSGTASLSEKVILLR